MRSLALFDEHADGDDDDGIRVDDGSQESAGDDDNGTDCGKEGCSSCRLLLHILVSPLSSPSPSPSPLIMKSFKRFTSDNFTGFSRYSSAPSSKHLLISDRISCQLPLT